MNRRHAFGTTENHSQISQSNFYSQMKLETFENSYPLSPMQQDLPNFPKGVHHQVFEASPGLPDAVADAEDGN